MRFKAFFIVLGLGLGLLGLGCKFFQKTEPIVHAVSSSQLNEVIKATGASLTIVNLWATFCGPCVEEFPDFVRFYKENQKSGVKLLFVSADFKTDLSEVKDFLSNQQVDFVTYIKDEADDTFISGFNKNWTGALPVTAFYNQKGELVHFASKPLSYAEIKKIAQPYLDQGDSP